MVLRQRNANNELPTAVNDVQNMRTGSYEGAACVLGRGCLILDDQAS